MAIPTPADNSSNSRKVAVPALAGAISILAVVAGHVLHAPISDSDYTVAAPALAVVITGALDIFLPTQFLA